MAKEEQDQMEDSKEQTTEEMKEANTIRLRGLILQELEDIHSIKNVQKKKPEFTAENAVNVEIKQFELELSVQKVYKDFKDHRFWL